jgi:hypothetical protein
MSSLLLKLDLLRLGLCEQGRKHLMRLLLLRVPSLLHPGSDCFDRLIDRGGGRVGGCWPAFGQMIAFDKSNGLHRGSPFVNTLRL